MSSPRLTETLESIALFSHFAPEQLDQLATCTSLTRFPRGVTILKEGDPTRDAYVVDRGEVRIERQTPYGKFALARLGAGEMFGEAGFVDRRARSGDAITQSDSRLLVLNPVALSTLTDRDPRFDLALQWTFWKSLSAKLRHTNDDLARFFTTHEKLPERESRRQPATASDFRIDMAAKRTLFQEQRLSSMEINFLASLSREEKLPAGRVIFREGEVGDKMYVVLAGKIRISKEIPGAGEEALAFLERGDYFGEMALIDDQPRSADARAHEGGAVVLAIPRDVVRGLLNIEKVSSVRLLKLLCLLLAKRLRELDEKIVGWHILSGGDTPTPEAG